MPVPVRYHVRSLFVRRFATGLTVGSIALSVGVFVVVLALARGFELSLVDSGRTDNVIFLRKGATSEGDGAVSRDAAKAILGLPEIRRDESGQTMAQPEVYAAIALTKAGGGSTNVPIRGGGPMTFRIRDQARVPETWQGRPSRPYRPGTYELVVGRALLERIEGCRLGGEIEFNGRKWPVVGVIDSGGAAFDSEIWGDVEIMLQIFERPGFSIVCARLADPSVLGDPEVLAEGADITAEAPRLEREATGLRRSVSEDPRIATQVLTEREYFTKQAGPLGMTLKVVAGLLATIMAVGAAFGATNTILASLASRKHEVGALLAIGYLPRHVCLGILLEGLLLGILGGVAGVLLSIPFNGYATGTTNWTTFTEQTFAFAVTPGVMLTGILFSAAVGIFGSVLPSLRAAKIRPVSALRDL